MGRTKRSIWVAGAVVTALVGALAPGASAQVPPPEVTVAGSDGVAHLFEGCDGFSEVTLDPASLTLTRAGDTSAALVVDVQFTGSLPVLDQVATIAIAAGETTVRRALLTPPTAGTVTITISDATEPGTFTVGSPATAEVRITEQLVVADCPATTTTTTEPAVPPPGVAPASPAAAIAGTASFTG